MLIIVTRGELAKRGAVIEHPQVVDLDESRPGVPSGAERADSRAVNDYFIERDGLRFAGTHLLIDLWGACHLDEEPVIREALLESVRTCGATLLHIHLHRFHENGGISGVAVLAESHISIHTWPERDYAAIDVFMCGSCQPHKAVAIFKAYFQPETVQLGEQRRGLTE